MMTLQEKAKLLRSGLFSDLPGPLEQRIATDATEIRLADGETLFQRGEPGDAIFVVVTGEIKILLDKQTVAILTPGEVLGEMAALGEGVRTADAVAQGEAALLKVSVEDLEAALAECPVLMKRFVQLLIRRLDASNRSRCALTGQKMTLSHHVSGQSDEQPRHPPRPPSSCPARRRDSGPVVVGLILLLLVGALGFGFYKLAQYLALGGDRIALETRVQSLSLALQLDAGDRLTTFVSDDTSPIMLEQLRACMLTGNPDHQVEQLLSLLPGEVTYDSSSGMARLPIRSRVKLVPPETEDGDRQEPVEHTFDVMWQWQRISGEWKYAGPLP